MKTFESLFAELSEKAATKQAGSLTVDELAKGTHFIGKKIVEEAGETWMRNPGPCQLKVWPFLEEKHAKNRCA